MYVIFCFVKPDTSLRDFTETVANECTFSALIDCCHSGAMLEGAKEIIGNNTVNHTINKPRTPKNRSYNFGEPSGRPPGVQISGCQNHQKACQVYFEDLEGWSTFFTQSFLSVIEETGGNMSNKELVERVAGNMAQMFDEKKLPKGDSRRNDPGLYCDERQKDFKFLSAES
jgi:hypothetical protein